MVLTLITRTNSYSPGWFILCRGFWDGYTMNNKNSTNQLHDICTDHWVVSSSRLHKVSLWYRSPVTFSPLVQIAIALCSIRVICMYFMYILYIQDLISTIYQKNNSWIDKIFTLWGSLQAYLLSIPAQHSLSRTQRKDKPWITMQQKSWWNAK